MNRKIENFFSSLDTLHEASVTDYTQNKIVLSGCVNTFCLTFELSWKAMKYVLESEGVDKGRTGSPKLILMEGENYCIRVRRIIQNAIAPESHSNAIAFFYALSFLFLPHLFLGSFFFRLPRIAASSFRKRSSSASSCSLMR